ncbi:MAG: thiamine pyrophosphate-binding protein [Betaproteobacteria bacterium]|nr:MAG: thiamine pyrophosphate-binding protein [Betaproteobacteria bacterium]
MTAAGSPAHGGDRVAAVLQAHGVPVLFTLCGGHISPILVAAKARGIAVVDTRHEATAVFAADAVARLTGIPGVVAVTAGPGLTNTITALKNAQLAQSPLVLLGGAVPTVLRGRGALQDIDQRRLIAPQVKRLWQVRRIADVIPSLVEAFAVAREGVPGPVFVECPVDILYDETSTRSAYAQIAGKGKTLFDRALQQYLKWHLARLFAGADREFTLRSPDTQPSPVAQSSVDRASAALASARQPLLVVGSQTVVRADQASKVAAALVQLGIPSFLSGMARGLLGRKHPLHIHHARREALRAADCVLLAGVPNDFRLNYGLHIRRSATFIAANRSAREARLNRRPTLTLLGDAGEAIERLAAALDGRAHRPQWLEQLHARDAAREAEIDERAKRPGKHVNALAFFRQLDRIAGEGAIFVADGGDFVATASYILQPRGPLAWLDPGAFGTLGVGAGFAIGAARARPGTEIWLIWGDGASGYGLAEFDTFVRHGIPVIAVIGNDASWAQIAREQVKILHDDVGTVLARTAYHEVAKGFGAEGIEVTRDAEVTPALARARELAAAGRPVLVNVWLDKTDFRDGSISL